MNYWDEFFELIKKSVELDPWVQEHDLAYAKFLKSESEEVIQAIKRHDIENLKEELGDIISIWATVCKIAERKNHFSSEDVIREAIKKIELRRPFVHTNQKVSMEEAINLWEKAKNAQR